MASKKTITVFTPEEIQRIKSLPKFKDKPKRKRLYNPELWKKDDLRPRKGEVIEVFGNPNTFKRDKEKYKNQLKKRRMV